MAHAQMNPVLRHIRRIAGRGTDVAELSDRELLERFTALHEEDVFETLVRRHGSLVLSVCRRVLNHQQDAEDVFQAVFLVLARKSGSIRKRASLGSWLFGVAYRLALKARTSAARRHAHERRFAAMVQTEIQPEVPADDLRALLDQELLRLPEKYRAPLVLCYLEGKTHLEAAQTLGWPSGSMSKRLEQAREMLRARLGCRGVALSGVAIVTSLADSASAAVPSGLVDASVKAGVLAATGQALAGTVSAHAASLAEGVVKTMVLAKIKVWTLVLLGVSVLTAGAIVAAREDEAQKEDTPREQPARVEAPTQVPADLALVPGEAVGFLRISVSQLWNLPAMKAARRQAGNFTADLLSRAEKAIGVPMEEIEKITATALPIDERGNPQFIFIFATSRPYARAKVQKALAPNGTETQHGGKTVFASQEGDHQAVYFVSDRIFVIADLNAMQAYLDLKADGKTPVSFDRAVKLASGNHHIVGWFQVPEKLATQARQAPLPENLGFLRPLLDVESGSLILDFARDARMRLGLKLPDETAAKQAVEAGRTGVVKLKEFMDQVPGEVRDDPLARILLQLAADALKNCEVVREESSLVLTAQTKALPVLDSVIPGIAKVRTAANRTQSTNNLKQLALAMHNYHATYQRFPPAALTDKNGAPVLSWRVAILPFIEQDALYKEFHLDEPWDSEHNKKLLAKMPKVYAPTNIETREPYTTLYKVFTGKSTAFEDPNGNKIAEFTDGTSNTLLVVEGAGPVPWTKPEDLPFDPDRPLPKMGGQFDDIFLGAMGDGSVRAFSMKIPEKTLRALITRNGGEVIEPDQKP